MTHYTNTIPKTSDRLSNFDRVKVDIGQTGFFEGREFRSFKELNIPGTGSYVIRAVVAADIILTELKLDIDSGWLRIATVLGGTPGGDFAETLPIFNRNNMSVGGNRRQAFVPQTLLTAGGTHTGGTELDVLRVKTAGVSQQANTVGATTGDERGVAANTYYFRLTNLHATDPVTGTLHVSWEERMAPTPAYPLG